MTVHFTDTPSDQPAGADVGLLLWPQLKSTSHSAASIDSVLLRCLVRGLTNDVPAPVIRRWLLANAEDPALRAAVATVPRWHRLVSSARRHALASGSAAGVAAARLEIARRWVARVTTPLPAGQLTWAKEVNARAALSVIAAQYIALGYDKIVVSAPWLGSQLGWTRAHAQGVLKTLEKDLGWISRAGKRSGAIRWKLARLGGDQGEELRDRAWLHAEAVDALAAQRPVDDKLATVLASVAAPAWHFSEGGSGKKVLGAKAWVALVHQHAGLPKDEGLGLVPRTLSKMKREVERELPGALAGTIDLDDALAFLAEMTGATARRQLREVQAVAEARANRERVERFRQDKAAKYEAAKKARAAFREVHHVDGTLGRPPADAAEFQAWVGQSARFWNNEGAALIEPAGLWAARELLARAIADAGHDLAMVERATAFVFREPVVAVAA